LSIDESASGLSVDRHTGSHIAARVDAEAFADTLRARIVLEFT